MGCHLPWSDLGVTLMVFLAFVRGYVRGFGITGTVSGYHLGRLNTFGSSKRMKQAWKILGDRFKVMAFSSVILSSRP